MSRMEASTRRRVELQRLEFEGVRINLDAAKAGLARFREIATDADRADIERDQRQLALLEARLRLIEEELNEIEGEVRAHD